MGAPADDQPRACYFYLECITMQDLPNLN